jgi:hypothetical protein
LLTRSKFANKKGTSDLNIVFTPTLACTKMAFLITKKSTFGPTPLTKQHEHLRIWYYFIQKIVLVKGRTLTLSVLKYATVYLLFVDKIHSIF